MALKALLLRKKLDDKKKDLDALRSKDQEFQIREAELETAMYACLAKAWIKDEDAVPDKAAAYYRYIVQHTVRRPDNSGLLTVCGIVCSLFCLLFS